MSFPLTVQCILSRDSNRLLGPGRGTGLVGITEQRATISSQTASELTGQGSKMHTKGEMEGGGV